MAKPAVAVVIAPTASEMSEPASRKITLNVTDPDLIAEIESWTDGEGYSFNVTQTAKNEFDVDEAYAAEEEAEETPVTPVKPGTNPAISNLLAKKPA